MSKEELSYGKAKKELDEILQALEEGEIEVDDLSGKVERAASLITLCREKLTRQETRIKKIVADLDQGDEG